MIVNDPSKELYLLSSGYLSRYFNIKVINFANSGESAGYNILSRIKKASDINKISHLLVSATLDKGGNSDPFWSLSTQNLLNILIRLIRHKEEKYRNMANVLYVLKVFSAKPSAVDKWIVETKDQELILDYRSLVGTPEKTLQNIVASARACLSMFEDEEILRVTSHDSIDIDALRKSPTIIFLHNSIAEMRYVNILNSIFFEQLYGHILSRLAGKEELDMFIILEEASSMYIPVLPSACANVRKHRVGNLVCVQSPIGQLSVFYGKDAKNITANLLTKIYLPGQTEMETLKEIETFSGITTVEDKHGAERRKPLITIEEIRQLPKDRSIILSSNLPVIKGRTSPFYRSYFKYKRFASLPPLPLASDIPIGAVELLPF